MCLNSNSIQWRTLRRKLNIFKDFKSLAATTLSPADKNVKSMLREPLNVRIDGTWFDLSGWRKAHPSGEHWIDMYKNRDATEVMQAFHSETAMKMLQKLPQSKTAEKLNIVVPEVTEVTKNFRKLRQKLIDEGWWKRDYLHEARLVAIWASLFFSGLFYAKIIPFLAIILLSFANTSAGWIGHDYIHGVDKFSFMMRNFASLTAGIIISLL